MITVTVTDSGGTANGGVNTATATFTVVVNPVNQQPTISQNNAVTVVQNSGPAYDPPQRDHRRPG